MPLVGFFCEATGEEVTFEECLRCSEYTPRCQFTYEMLYPMTRNSDERKDAGISITSLLGCQRKSYYALATKYHWWPHLLWPATRGTMFHSMVEEYANHQSIYETRFGARVGGIYVTGQMDKITPRRKLVTDYKTKEELPDVASTDYVWQLNGYRLILDDGEVVTPGKRGIVLEKGAKVHFDIQKLGLAMVTMSEVRKYGVPVQPLERVHAFFGKRAWTLSTALSGGPLPDRQVPEPRASKFCTEWCPFYLTCISSP